MKLSKTAIKRLALLALAIIGCLLPALPAAAAPPQVSRAEALAALKNADAGKLNPQHFGALSGYGQIYLQLGQPEKALEYFRRALAINPNLDGVREIVELLETERAAHLRKSI